MYGSNHSTRKAIYTTPHPRVCRGMVPHHWSDITKRADEGSLWVLQHLLRAQARAGIRPFAVHVLFVSGRALTFTSAAMQL